MARLSCLPSTKLRQLFSPAVLHDREARRLFHGRGGCFSYGRDLFIDCFPPVVHIALFSPPAPDFLSALTTDIPEPFVPVLQRRDLPGSPCQLLRGAMPESPVAIEQNLQFRLFFDRDRNVGFFPDMAVGRRFLRQRAAGKRILNLFAYTCSLSVAALAGGAREVVNLDMNRNLLNVGRENHDLNGLDPRKVSYLPHDLFKSFGLLRRLAPFDLVIVDPPDSQGNSFRPQRDWPRLLRRLPELLAPDGQMLLAVSSARLGLNFLQRQVESNLAGSVPLAHLTAGEDFPEADANTGLHLLHLALRPGARPGAEFI